MDLYGLGWVGQVSGLGGFLHNLTCRDTYFVTICRFINFRLVIQSVHINKKESLSILGVCVSWIGRVEDNIFNQPINGELRKFQSASNPPIYKSSGLVENLNDSTCQIE